MGLYSYPAFSKRFPQILPLKKTQARTHQSDFLNYNRFGGVQEVRIWLFVVLTHL